MMENFETIPCPLCQSEKSHTLRTESYPENISSEKLIDIYKSSSDQKLFEKVEECDDCGLVYLNPRLRSDLIVSSYEDGVDPEFAAQNALRIRTFRASLQKIIQFIAKPKLKVLDIGCAGGAFLEAAKTLGLDVEGIEPSRYLSEHARNTYGVKVHQGTLEGVNLPENSYDLVTLWDVIEHLTQPIDTLKQCHRIIKKDGHIVINYPDYTSWPARILKWKWPFWLSVHLTYFDPKTVKELLSQSGFKTVHTSKHYQTLELAYILERASAYFGFFKFFQKLAIKLKLGSIPIKYYLGQIQVIAEKK